MPIFDWGTYNGFSKLKIAELLGTRLTEIPPRVFMRRIDESYFRSYGEAAKYFTTITAHAPYYSLISYDAETRERSIKALKRSAELSVAARAEIYNMHIGPHVWGGERDIDAVADAVKEIISGLEDKLYFSLETSHAPWLVGSFEEIRAIIEKVGSERVIVSPQLENVFIYELGVHGHGRFDEANRKATKDFWLKVLEKTLRLSKGYFSLRFAQVTGFYLGNKLLKKRVPLGKGYPDLEPLAEALAEFIVKKIYEPGLPMEIHLIYTGPPATKYRDTIRLYQAVMERVLSYIK